MNGIEIKFDNLIRKHGNIYIEVAEKAHAEREQWTPSGAFKSDNSWLYAIGDEQELFVFDKKQLQRLYMMEVPDELVGTPIPRFQRKSKPTSRGYVLPVEVARKCAATILTPRDNAKERRELAKHVLRMFSEDELEQMKGEL